MRSLDASQAVCIAEVLLLQAEVQEGIRLVVLIAVISPLHFLV